MMNRPTTPVWLALIAGLPAIIAAIGSIYAVHLGVEQKAATAEVHALVNSRFTAVEQKLETALATIAKLTGEPAKSVESAPSQ